MIQSFVWVCVRWFPFGAAAYLLIVFLFRRMWRELPFFLCYLASALLTGVLRYATLHVGQRAYFYTYWISDLFVSLTVLLAIYEVFLRRLFVRFHKTTAYRRAFPVAGTVVFILTVASALIAADKGATFQMASRAFDFMRTAILLFFIGLMTLMGRQWSRYDLGIALGFGLQAAVALTAAAIRTRANYVPTFWDSVEMVAYDVSCLIWIITFSLPDKTGGRPTLHGVDVDHLYQTQKWEAVLKQWLKRKNPTS
jgi:hypothetical protein